MATDDFQERLRRIQAQKGGPAAPEGTMGDAAAPQDVEDDTEPKPTNPQMILLAALVSLPLGLVLGVLTGLYFNAAQGLGHSPMVLGLLGSIYALVLAGLIAGFLWVERLPLAFPACLVGLIGAGIGTLALLVL